MANLRWLIEHFSDLARSHSNQWVAIYGGGVIAADVELGLVSVAAARIAPPRDTVFHFIDDGSQIFVI